MNEEKTRKATILLVEDDQNIQKLLTVTFQRAGFQTVGALNGFEALAAIDRFHPDLIVTDIMMPELNGLDMIKAIHNRPETESLPIIIISAKDSVQDVLAGLNSGALYYLTKPLKINELIAQVKFILGDFG